MIKEVIGDCTLYLGDCLKVMPSLEPVNVLVTDPPWGLGEPTGNMSKKNGHKRAYIGFDDTEDYLRTVTIHAVIFGLRLSSGRGIITPGSKHAWKYPEPDVLGTFYQPAAVGMCSWGRQTSQPILFYGSDPRSGKTIQDTSYRLTEPASTTEHPCAKPQNAWDWVVNRASLEGETVFDPFMGSGTTGVSCVKLGRKFIGIELEKTFFDLSCRRIEAATREPGLFQKRATQMEVNFNA